jgi:nucleotide-binding universal stress UspA family protein
MEDKVITIITCSYARALLIQGQLESEGIECYLKNINLVQPDIATGVNVRIHKSDADKAYSIIETMKDNFGEGKMEAVNKLKNIRRILVPVDFSEFSIVAIDYAIGLAQVLKAEVKLFYSYYNPIIGADPTIEGQSYTIELDSVINNLAVKARSQMKTLKSEIQKRIQQQNLSNVKLSYTLDTGSPADVILHQIKKYNPGLIIMGTKGAGQNSNNILGSVTQKVIEKSPIPVLTIPENSKFKGVDFENEVMYATNFDSSDFKSLRKLMTLVRPFDMKIHFVHFSMEEDLNLGKAKMDGLKKHFLEEYSDSNIKCNTIVSANVEEGIQKYIQDYKIDLIALTTHKRGVIEKMFNPSLTKKMLYHTNIPLLVFHS